MANFWKISHFIFDTSFFLPKLTNTNSGHLWCTISLKISKEISIEQVLRTELVWIKMHHFGTMDSFSKAF